MTNKNIILRYIKAEDIADYIRWTTIETEWCDWDAPWEEDNLDEFVERQRIAIKEIHQIYGKLKIDTIEGRHIGWVSSYFIDADKTKLGVGIDIVSIDDRGKGYGENALTLFMAYLFKVESKLYIQTWSGNVAMLRLIEKIGFSEINREKDCREVRGKKYDAITLSITKEDFLSKYIHLCLN